MRIKIKRCLGCRFSFNPRNSQVRCAKCQREALLRQRRESYHRHKFKNKQKQREYYQFNLEYFREKGKRFRESHPNYLSNYRINNQAWKYSSPFSNS